jgi:hypothetical protein
MTRADYWLTKFSKLRVDRARGDPAPHKPLLLLVLCDLVEKENLRNAVLPLSPELAFRFYTYWSIVAERRPQRPDCAAQRDIRALACHAVILESAAERSGAKNLALDFSADQQQGDPAVAGPQGRITMACPERRITRREARFWIMVAIR